MQSAKKGHTGVLALIAKLLAKIGGKLLPLVAKLGKGAKVTKGVLAASSFASYAYLFTWQFALMIMVMLFIHESGHIWAMKRYGIKTKGIYFLPFVGGAAVAEEDFPSRKAEVVVAIMGPIWGFALALATGLVYFATKNPLFAAASSWMAMINLFNLLPISPLDGGRIFKSVAFSINSKIGFAFLAFGVVACGLIAYYAGIGLFVLLLVFGSVDLWNEYRAKPESQMRKIKKKIRKVEIEICETKAEINENQLNPCEQNCEGDCPHCHDFHELNQKLRGLRSKRRLLQYVVSLILESRKRIKERFIRKNGVYIQKNEKVAESKSQKPLNKFEIFGSVCSYFVVTAILFGLMYSMNHVEGAKIAMEILRG